MTRALFPEYMRRARVDEILKSAVYPDRRSSRRSSRWSSRRGAHLVYVIAGAGYGKTRAVRHFADALNDKALWCEISESDNVIPRFWENFTRSISFENPDAAEELRELSFPETISRFKIFARIIKNANLNFLIFDDFHLITAPEILTFTERCANLTLCLIIISRKEPGINVIPLFAKDAVRMVTEEELKFTEDEIGGFLTLCDIPYSSKNLPLFLRATGGWALAVRFLSYVLAKRPDDAGPALDIMKENVFKLFEAEAWRDFSEEIKKTLVKHALVSDLPPAFWGAFGSDFLRENAFVWQDSLSGDRHVHPLYLDFLRGKEDILTASDKQDVYARAADWCGENNMHLDAMRYRAKSGQHARMVEAFFSGPMRLPADVSGYYLGILEGLEVSEESVHTTLLKKYFTPMMMMGAGEYERAREHVRETAEYFEAHAGEIPYAGFILYLCHAAAAYIDMYICTVTHKYKAPEYMKKAVRYLRQLKLPPAREIYAAADIRSYACLVGVGAELADFGKFQEAARDVTAIAAEAGHGVHAGYDRLVAAEIHFYKNEHDEAAKYAHLAVAAARETRQHSIETMAKQYLLRIAVHRADTALVKEMLNQLRDGGASGFRNRHILYDLIMGLFCSLVGLPSETPSWLLLDDKEAEYEQYMPIAELSISLRNLLARKKYGKLLAVLYNSYPRKPHERFIFSEICFALMAAAAKIKTNDEKGALEDFRRAYDLSFGGVFEVFFIEMGKNLRPLVSAALASDDIKIPRDWLKRIDRKASVYAKKAAVIAAGTDWRTGNTGGPVVRLSERELEVLTDLYHGLSREEIAENRYLSVNTVKKILQSIYNKLEAGNNIDAVRIAIERGLLSD